VIFINTADGNAVDQHALTKRILAGEIVGLIDVYPGLSQRYSGFADGRYDELETA
jgi:lactate dehydrogenase-like 2-hydroxyacid dehydrogenase